MVRIVKEHYLRDDIANPLNSAGAHHVVSEPAAGVLHGQDCELHPKEKGGKGGKASKFVVMDASCFPYQVR